MIGIDTNLIVRLLTNDDKEQAKYALNLLEHNEVFIAKSVLLETEWVLRYTYEFDSKAIYQAFENLLGLPKIKVEDPACIIKAMKWYTEGFDFADALHLATSLQVADEFATFDKALIKRAKKINVHIKTISG